MVKEKIENLLKEVIGEQSSKIKINVFVPADEKFGHYSTNVAFILAKQNKKSPIEIAKEISSSFIVHGLLLVDKIEVASPGFINFWLKPEIFQEEIKEILKQKEKYGKNSKNKNQELKIQIEFISANPTGPLTIGNGRGAFLGDVLANILEFQGNKVTREYYINDAKNSLQIKELGKTALGEGDTYLTKNIKILISKIKPQIVKLKSKNPENLEGEVGRLLAKEVQKQNKQFIEKKLKIKFDKWFNEESLYESGAVADVLERLKKKNLVYESEGALWFKATKFGDEKDRVLVRKSGEESYFLSDLAYHLNKFEDRKFDKVIEIWGADHHGYVPRIKAGLQAFGIFQERLTVIITQLVRLIKNGKEVRMSKRKGEYLTLEDLINEISLDSARFFFLMYSPDTHMDFNLDLAKERSIKNPVYYVQYAAVRCQSILRKSKFSPSQIFKENLRRQENLKSKVNLKLLETKEDIVLMQILARFPEIIEEATEKYNPQILVRYSLDLAKEFHNFYEKERIIVEDKELTNGRLRLVYATLIIFKNIFKLLGITLPKKM